MSDTLLGDAFLESVTFRFEGLRKLGDGALAQLAEDDLRWSPGPESNSISVIMQHLHGNMMSRWMDFLTSDGEKEWRDRDGEFTPNPALARADLARLWDEGWSCLFQTLRGLTSDDLLRQVVIRGQSLSVLDAIERQVSHYGYHIGQIVFLARMRKGADWKTLSIARDQSKVYHPQTRD